MAIFKKRRPDEPSAGPGPPQADLELEEDLLDLPLGSDESAAPSQGATRPSAPPQGAPPQSAPPQSTPPAVGSPPQRVTLGGSPRAPRPGPPGRRQRPPGTTDRHRTIPARRPRPRRRVSPLWTILALVLGLAGGAAAGFFLRLTPAAATLSTEILDFGEVRLGSRSEPQMVEVQNLGGQALAIRSATLTGDAAAELAIVADGCSGQEITPESGCLLRLAFAPGTQGPRQARLEIESNAVNGGLALPMIGFGVTPELRFEPSRLDFGSLKVGVASSAATLRLANTGSTRLALHQIELGGLGAADFVLLEDGCGGQDLGAGERCSIRYRFVPTAEGLRRAEVQISSDAPIDVSPWLLGIGLPQEPILRLDPERLEFGALPVGDASSPSALAIHNDGDGPLQIVGITASIAEITEVENAGAAVPGAFEISAEQAGFELTTDRCTGHSVPPGGQCEIEIVFRPRAEGEARAFFEVRHSAQQGAHTLPVFGIGTVPHVFIDPLRLGFGEVPLEQASSPRTIRIVSSGSAPLRVTDLTVEGADRRSFGPPVSDCTGQALAPRASCQVEIRFRPRRDGPHRAELLIRHSAPEGSRGERGLHRLPLNGLGVSARLAVNPVRLDLGNVDVGGVREGDFEISNSGRSELKIRGLRLGGSYANAFETLEDSCTGQTLGQRQACGVRVRFRPTQAGTRNATLKIDHTAVGSPTEITITASATEPLVPKIRLEPPTLEFYDHRVGQRSAILTIAIDNPGNGRLVLEGTTVAGEHAADYRAVPGSCEGAPFIAPGAQCTIGVQFTPTAEGPRQAELVVRHNGEGGSARVGLSGVGSVPPPVP